MFDAYTRRARLAPALLAALPAIALLACGLFKPSGATSALALAAGAVGVVVCGVVRKAGRELEGDLWNSWGGPPTRRALRFSAGADASSLHVAVTEATGVVLPTREEEASDPAAGDARYDEAIAVLRGLTRSTEQFPLIFDENATYGFRRNCLGIKPLALWVSAAMFVVALGLFAASGAEAGKYIVAMAAALACAGFWLRLVTPDWVKAAADLYARRMLESPAILNRAN